MLNKADMLLVIVIMIGGLALWFGLTFFMQTANGIAVVSLDGVTVGKHDLGIDEVVILEGYEGGYNLLVISDGIASVTEAGCPDRFCVRQRDISKRGESIICLPHRLVIRIEQGEEGEIDAVTY